MRLFIWPICLIEDFTFLLIVYATLQADYETIIHVVVD